MVFLLRWGGSGVDDTLREQSRVTEASGAIGDLKVALKAVTICLEPAWIPSVFSFMRSMPGGVEQESHQDYPASVIASVKKKKKVPASVVYALEDGTQLRVYDGCTETKDASKARVLSIPKGFCVIFRGDLIHNGMPYDEENHRVHCYLTYKGLAWEPDIVSNVLPPHFSCQYCGKNMLSSDAIRQHRRYCEQNHVASKNLKTRRAPRNQERTWVCNVCGKEYDNDSSYRTHVARGHAKK